MPRLMLFLLAATGILGAETLIIGSGELSSGEPLCCS